MCNCVVRVYFFNYQATKDDITLSYFKRPLTEIVHRMHIRQIVQEIWEDIDWTSIFKTTKSVQIAHLNDSII